MKLKFLLFIFLLSGLGACAFQEPQVVIIDSNVSAFVYQGDKRLGETPYVGKVNRQDIGKLILKKSGYETVELPVEKVYSREVGMLTSQLPRFISDEGKETPPLITSLLLSSPLFTMTDATILLNGYWIEYMPNSFYVEMVPVNKRNASVDILRNWQIKNFALKMYPSLAAGNREALTAMASVSGYTEDSLAVLLAENSTPVSFAEAVTRF